LIFSESLFVLLNELGSSVCEISVST
jgi:hypothetical protein